MSKIVENRDQLESVLKQVKVLRACVEQQLDLLADLQIKVEIAIGNNSNMFVNFNEAWKAI